MPDHYVLRLMRGCIARIDAGWIALVTLGLVFGLGHVFVCSRSFFIASSWIAALLLSVLILWDRCRALGPVALRAGVLLWLLGFSAEVAAVHTGFPFGQYSYGAALGPEILGVPVAMGFAWMIVVLGAQALAHRLVGDGPLRSIRLPLAALACVVFDWAMEPVAVTLHYWTWEGDAVPLSNYFGWFSVALIGIGLVDRLPGYRPSPTAFRIWVCGLVFFLLLRVIVPA